MNGPESPAAGDRIDVLLVEDTLEDALLIRTILESEVDCKVTLAQDGIRGCQLVENQEWDLVVADLNLPGRDGMEVIQTSKEAFPDTPVLATTAYTGSHYIDQALRSGADDILPKPFTEQELMEKVEVLVRDRRKQRVTGALGGGERSVLAIGALPGDVELGCGGILLGHRAHGHDVGVLIMSAGGEDKGVPSRKEEAERAARELGCELVLADPFRAAIPSVDEMLAWLGEAVERLDPDTVYTPSLHDVRDSRLRPHQAAIVAASEVPNHYCYQAATTTLEFRPTLFIDVAEYMQEKLKILAEYNAQSDFRPHLQPYIARASAQYWGRFLGYGEVEPLEVVRSEM